MYYGEWIIFLSTLPARGATPRRVTMPAPSRYFYPRSPRGERRTYRPAKMPVYANFYPRSPRGERRSWRMRSPPGSRNFYPRSPRGERLLAGQLFAVLFHFYPRSPRGERHRRCRGAAGRRDFYPRAPRGERRRTPGCLCHQTYFYPRSPRGERPMVLMVDRLNRGISIHAPREGSDRWTRSGRAKK